MTSLTDRYAWAVVRTLPQKQRADIDRELRASIADDIDARLETGADAAAAERETLLALGDPDRLAAGYAQRPSLLIGPRYYFDYLRLLKVLYFIVLPIAFATILAGKAIAGEGIGSVIGGSIAAAITVAAHFGFWPTLVFALIERSDAARKEPLTTWKLESLPQLPDVRAGAGIGQLIGSVAFLLFFAGAIVWQQFSSVFTDAAGRPIPLLQPDLWTLWIPYTLVLIGLELVFAVVLYANHRWTWQLAIVNVVLNVAFLVPATWLVLENRVYNPGFLDRLGWLDDNGVAAIAPIMVLVFVGIVFGDAADGIVKARKAARAVAQ